MLRVIRSYVFVLASFLFIGACMIGFFSTRAQQKWDAENIDRTINFANNMNWQQVQQKAKEEGKQIFMDCFATWCVPCKRMDQKVFTDVKVAKFFNEHFIAVKVQMDKTNTDNEWVKRWYTDAATLESAYDIQSFPSYLFFNADGTPLHKAVGYMEPDALIDEAKRALSPDRGFYAIQSKADPEKLDTAQLRMFAWESQKTDKAFAGKMAAAYLDKLSHESLKQEEVKAFMMAFSYSSEVGTYAAIYLDQLSPSHLSDADLGLLAAFKNNSTVRNHFIQYLEQLPNNQIKQHIPLLNTFGGDPEAKNIANRYLKSLSSHELYTDENLRLLHRFTTQTTDFGFKIVYDPSSAKRYDNSIVKMEGYTNPRAKDIANYAFSSQFLSQYIVSGLKGEGVNWKSIAGKFYKKFRRTFVDENVLAARVMVLEGLTKQNEAHRPEYIKCKIELLDKYGWDTTNQYFEANGINNFAFGEIFEYSTDPKQLDIAIRWMEGVIRRNPDENMMDTYANLLYKRGRKDLALHMQEKALQQAQDKNSIFIDNIEKNLDKMKRGEPTWTNN